jgi:molecular chaperone DnaK
VRADVDALKTALAGTDDDAVDTAMTKLQESQGKLGEALYANQPEGEPAAEASADDEDIIDAEVVEDEDNQK